MTIPEQYEKERQTLEQNRTLDWSSFYMEYTAAGEKLELMTVQTWFDLLALDSPIVMGEVPSVESLIDYIWRNTKRRTDNRLLKEWRLWGIKRRVVRALVKESTAEDLINVVLSHIKNSLSEFPVSMSSGGTRSSNTLSQYSGEASMVDEIASRYSMHPDEVLKMPLRKAFSLQRVIRISTIPDYKILEPDSLREIKSKYLNQINDAKK